MALPYLLKYIYDNATDEVIRRGKRIFLTGGATLAKADTLLKTAIFQVKSDTHANSYRVTVNKYAEAGSVSVRCQCPYNLGEICRHEAAALFQLQDLLDKNFLQEEEMQYDQRHTVVKMKNIDLKSLRLLSSRELFVEAEHIARHHQAAITTAQDEHVEATLTLQGKAFPLTIRRNEDRSFDTRCTCNETGHPLCKHKTALFLQLLNAYGPYYFDTLKNWNKEKDLLLERYGYSLKDDLEGKFAFSYVNGKPFLRVLDASLKKIHRQVPVSASPAGDDEDNGRQEAPARHRLAVVFSDTRQEFPYLGVMLVQGETNEEADAFISPVKRVDLNRYMDYYAYSYPDRELITRARKLQTSELNKYLNRNSPFAALWENIYIEDGENLPEDTRHLILDYMYSRIKKLQPLLSKRKLVFWLPAPRPLKTDHLEAVTIREQSIRPEFTATVKGENVAVSCHVVIDGEKIPVGENRSGSPLLFLHKNALYCYDRKEDVLEVDKFMQWPETQFGPDEWPAFLEQKLLPLSREYRVHFDDKLISEQKSLSPQPCIRLKELGEMLVFHPSFIYLGQEAAWNDEETITLVEEGKVKIVHRNKALEESFIRAIKMLHPSFDQVTHHRYFYLQAKEAIKKNWFFRFSDTLKELGAVLAGFESLKSFRFNPNKPRTQLNLSSGIDWFDAQVEVLYGDQSADIREIKKALAARQDYVRLADGSLGLLPEQWMKKYSLLFRMGEESDRGLRISKYNFSVIDELYDNIDDEQLLIELEEKKKRLLRLEEFPETAIPKNVKAVMRSYQENGFQWLCYLHEIKWGGILADDMGLGKTLQTLSFLQYLKNKQGYCQALVVCPTTLIYNWENEIGKFTPGLTYLIHHGPARSRKTDEITGPDILITTYGTLRSDVQLLQKLRFDYVILDESQTIKNPHSKVAKAAQLLRTGNRLCLSGTPMQNNTFDIYAQMNFLNPGMLGSMDFFRNEFASPIDKGEDQERKEHLRKLIYPFILRRTKEQVARDLPPKSEMVLFCEMDKEQQKIYDAFRNMYRSKILGTIDEQGMGRSQLTILQGLMKLRQICDSPAILHEDEQYPNHSVKLDELTRGLQENTGNHKVLIFSQFLGMLALIRSELEKLDIPFEYFDGSTSAIEREKAIKNFQENEGCRVFLISLKAGGVGLNLTAADYVYLVDPWWNPAVEQQAIDRTHRIGQDKSIFAYRMICKNTVEEKILQLQEKKKSLVKDIISDESGFIKKLTRDDVLYLFS